MIPGWLHVLAYIWLSLSAVSFLIIVTDVPRQNVSMPIMKLVWPLTTLYMGPIGLYAYFKLGRNVPTMHHDHQAMDHDGHGENTHANGQKMHHTNGDSNARQHHEEHHINHGHESQEAHHQYGDRETHRNMNGSNKPFWQSVFVSSTHCGGGCALGDAIGGPLVFGLGLIVAGSSLFADYIVEFVLAYLFGIAFQYFGMGFTHRESLGKGLKNAIKADTWSLIAYEIGMFGWMALVHVFFVHVPEPDNSLYWFMMQIAMMIGFVTSYPANWVLVKIGVKHAM